MNQTSRRAGWGLLLFFLSAGAALAAPAGARTGGEMAQLYLWLGFTHILPKGLDHMLFVAALFLGAASLRSLLVQVTMFTLAHTLTLALAASGVITLPANIVEPLIALSIVFVAIENIFFKESTRWRYAVVFGFGLFHGLGFAGVLKELGLPSDNFLAALLSFNVGVELGQVAVIALLFLPAMGLRWLLAGQGRLERYHSFVVIPASLLIAAAGLFWFAQRTVL